MGKTPKENLKTIRFPVFGYTLHVIVTDNLHYSRNRRNRQIGDSLPPSECFIEGLHSYCNHTSWIFLRSDTRWGIIAHEAWHCVRRMLEVKGAALENEVVAYHLGFIVSEIQPLFDAKLRK